MTAHNRKLAKADKSASRSCRTLHQISLLILLCLLRMYASGKSNFALK